MQFTVDGIATFAAGHIPPGHAGTVVVLLHGAAMDHTVWTYHTRYFMHRGMAVVAPDLPAHGQSHGTALSSIADMAAWLGRCLDELGARRVALAGHSMGALVALQLAAEDDARIERLALLGAAAPMVVSDQLLDAARIDSPLARELMMFWGHGAGARMGGNAIAGINIVKTAMRLLERAPAGLLYTDLNACNAYLDGEQAGRRVRAATRLICGQNDKMTPPKVARKLADVLANGALEVIPDCGHMLMSEQPEFTHRALVNALL
jgi:pimeloyl-ACP methyl ester carboxylesterase